MSIATKTIVKGTLKSFIINVGISTLIGISSIVILL